MIEQTLFKTHFVGKDGFVWWIGQVASEESWIANIPETPDQAAKGFGERYKVRIMGYHTAAPKDLPDEELPWATVMYPVTAGGGGRGNYESSAIAQGTFVFGFFLDGDDAQQPVIMGCMGYNDYGQVMKTLSERKPFLPFSGFTERDQQEIGAGIKKSPKAPNSGPNPGIPVDTPNESVPIDNLETATVTNNRTEGELLASVGGKKKSTLTNASTSEPSPLSALSAGIKNAIQTIQELQKIIQNARNASSGFIKNIETQINTALNQVSSFISGLMKTVFNKVMETVLDAFNKVIGRITGMLPITVKPEVEDLSAKAAEQIVCLFKGLIGNIFGQIKSFVMGAANAVVNVSQCFMNNFVGDILGKIKNGVGGALGVIGGTISGVLDGIEGAADAVGGVLEMASGVLDAIDSLFKLSFNFCPNESDNQSIVTEWSILFGVGKQAKPGSDLISRAKSKIGEIGDTFSDIGNNTIQGGFTETFGNAFNIDSDLTSSSNIFGDIKSACDEELFELCGPPSLLFNSKTGKGAAGNLIIGTAGELLGVDMTDFGFDYKGGTRALVSDNCGTGIGGRVRPLIGPVKKSKRVKVRSNSNVDIEEDEIVISPLNGGGLPGLNGGGPNGEPGSGPGGGGSNDEVVIQNTGTSTGDFIGAGALGGSIKRFELYETLGVQNDFYPKGLGEFSKSVYGGLAELWNDLTESATAIVSLPGGSGTGFRAVVRFEALAGAAGNPNNTSYAVMQILDEGDRYKVGDILEFPDVNGLPISEAGDQFRLRVAEVSPYDDTEETTGIIGAVVTNRGKGYLRKNDGSKGGDGRTWAETDETVVIHDNGTFDPPTAPGLLKCFEVGDRVILPNNTSATIEPSGQELIGGVETLITEAGCITTPIPTDTDDGDGIGADGTGAGGNNYPDDNQGKYPVVLRLDDLIIDDSGQGYDSNDSIVIEPSFGAEAKPEFDQFGRLRKVNITNPGEGFNTMPDVYIKSKTGFNAELLPKFGIDRIGKDRVQDYDPEKVIQVIDCVGRFT